MGADCRGRGWSGFAEDERAMIRINLLPIKQQRRRTAGRTQIVVFAALVVLEVLVLGLLYMTQTSNL